MSRLDISINLSGSVVISPTPKSLCYLTQELMLDSICNAYVWENTLANVYSNIQQHFGDVQIQDETQLTQYRDTWIRNYLSGKWRSNKHGSEVEIVCISNIDADDLDKFIPTVAYRYTTIGDYTFAVSSPIQEFISTHTKLASIV